MTQKAPKWKRLGFQTDSEYRAACSAKRKTQRAALLATSAGNTADKILRILWDNAEFHAPKVTTTKEQLMAEAKCCLLTVKTSLATLRAEGSIKPIAGFGGGRGIPTTYRLCVAGHELTPSDNQIELMEAKREREAAWRFLKGKYGPLKALEILGSDPTEND